MKRCLRHFRKSSAAVLFFTSLLFGQSGLKIDSFTFRQFEGGPAWPSGHNALSGDTIAFDFQVAGFKTIDGELDDKVQLNYVISAVDQKGNLLAEPVKGKVEAEVTPEDRKKDWKPKVAGAVTLPQYLASTNYTIHVSVQDQVAKSEMSADFPFSVKGPMVEQGTSITARNFRFLREEADGDPLEIAAYRDGDIVWARFEMTGFRTKDKAIDISYGLAVANSSGKRMFEQPIAVEEKKSFFYPPAYLPGVISLQLQKNTPKGVYTIELTVNDRNAQQSTTSKHEFSIE